MQRAGFLRGLIPSRAIVAIVRRGRAAVVVGALCSLSGCYKYTAVPVTEPMVEKTVELRINDAGRVELLRQMGPGALLVEGRVVRQSDAGWALQVYRLTTVRGDVTTWTGELVQISAASVELVRHRDFDRRRSMLAAAASAGTVTLFVLSRSLLGGGNSPLDRPPPPDGVSIRF